MKTITCASLSGGQGKTTTAIFLSKLLAEQGKKVLCVDADPQSSLTLFLGHEVGESDPTLLEVVTKQVATLDGIYENDYNIWLIPSDDALDNAQEHLAKSGMGAIVLKKRLKEVDELFDYCIIDAPPQRSQIALTTIAAADYLVVPAEATSKGLNCLLRTLELVAELKEIDAFEGEFLGVIPFRDRWTGINQAKQSQRSIQEMKEIVGEHGVLPSIIESEQFKKSIDTKISLSKLGYSKLEYPFHFVINVIEEMQNG